MVSVITVNYNGLTDTCEMIESFRRYETYPYEIIVVDNGSRSPEGEIIRNRYPDVKVVTGSNRGFAGGNNAALPLAAGDYLFFLNNDTLLRAPILESMVRRLQSDRQIGGEEYKHHGHQLIVKRTARSYRQHSSRMQYLTELVTDATGNGDKPEILDTSTRGPRTSPRQHGKNQQHPCKRRPQVVVVREFGIRNML